MNAILARLTRRRMMPGISSDQCAATLAKGFGVTDTALASVAPHVGNFEQADLGFLLSS